MSGVRYAMIGTWRDVAIDIATWDAVGAQVELSCAGLFAREAAGEPLAGGLRNLDIALGGKLLGLRRDHLFGAAAGQTLQIDVGATLIAAPTLLLIGLGEPEVWSAAVMATATCVGAREAIRCGVATAGFAPGMIDSGLSSSRVAGTEDAMLRGVTDAIDAAHALAALGLAARPALERWSFGAGKAHLDSAAAAFRASFAGLGPDH